ncbi:MAG: hypothetical protein BWK73_20010 [Thiothrix lacustris]|uniref:Uncharacterized protein n=1 Tax=Thiothrix lacustris TaxID=525917 RepID=A0A1Y1QPG7_9GAMM|nr:MAG: hypothetical protein BWK73_20010 [Thiothrix lacustris]
MNRDSTIAYAMQMAQSASLQQLSDFLSVTTGMLHVVRDGSVHQTETRYGSELFEVTPYHKDKDVGWMAYTADVMIVGNLADARQMAEEFVRGAKRDWHYDKAVITALREIVTEYVA